MMEDVSRRKMIAALGSFSVVAALGMPRPLLAAPADGDPYAFFSFGEAQTVRALVDTFIPAGGEGPGGLEAGVDRFLDNALGSAYGAGAGQYLDGPIRPGGETQGYQLALTPADFYRLALSDIDASTTRTQRMPFARLTPAARTTTLKAIEGGQAQLPTLPGKVVAQTMWFDIQCGYFADPIYGGNRDMAAWRHVGFPGAVSEFRQHVGRRDGFRVRPVGLAQITGGTR